MVAILLPFVAAALACVSAAPAARPTPAPALLARHRADNDSGSHEHASSASHEYIVDFPIHDSCNKSQKVQLTQGLKELNELASTAADHLLQYGNNSDLFK